MCGLTYKSRWGCEIPVEDEKIPYQHTNHNIRLVVIENLSMKRLYLVIITTLISLFPFVDINAQRLTFSSELGYFNSDKNCDTIAQLWKSYINAIDTGTDSSQFWIDKSSDIHIGLHKDGLLNTYNIRKITDTIYEINTIAYYPDSAIKGGLINSIYKVCALQTDNGWRLMNYFDAVKERYTQYYKGCVEFYIGSGVDIDDIAMEESAKFADTFFRNYNLTNSSIVYVAGSSIDECANMIGLTYTPIRSYKLYAGRTINNIILSTRLDHLHEIVHAIMLPLYPNAPLFLHEGIATYYGGAVGEDYKTIKSIARAFIEQHNIDFNSNDYLDILLSEDIQLSNIVAATIIEYALQRGGEGEVLRLFEATNYDQIFELLNVTNDHRTEFIRNLF